MSDLYRAQVSEENEGALRMAAKVQESTSESSGFSNDVKMGVLRVTGFTSQPIVNDPRRATRSKSNHTAPTAKHEQFLWFHNKYKQKNTSRNIQLKPTDEMLNKNDYLNDVVLTAVTNGTERIL